MTSFQKQNLKPEDTRLPCHGWAIMCSHCDCGSVLLDQHNKLVIFLTKGDALKAAQSADIDPKYVQEVKIMETVR